MTCWRSMASWSWARCRAGSPESSKTMSLTGCPLRPPLALTALAHSWAPSVTGLSVDAAGPDWVPTVASTTAEPPGAGGAGAGPGVAGAPGAGFGAVGFGVAPPEPLEAAGPAPDCGDEAPAALLLPGVAVAAWPGAAVAAPPDAAVVPPGAGAAGEPEAVAPTAEEESGPAVAVPAGAGAGLAPESAGAPAAAGAALVLDRSVRVPQGGLRVVLEGRPPLRHVGRRQQALVGHRPVEQSLGVAVADQLDDVVGDPGEDLLVGLLHVWVGAVGVGIVGLGQDPVGADLLVERQP